MCQYSDLFRTEAGTPIRVGLTGSCPFCRKALANHLTSHLKYGVGSWKLLPLISHLPSGGSEDPCTREIALDAHT